MKLLDLPESFLDRIQVEPNSGCWLWTGWLEKEGYARIRTGGRGGPQILVHRIIYEFGRGPIPAKLVCDHRCRTPCCVNPTHIESVTDLVNVRRGLKVALKKSCKNGHPWIPENILTRRRKTGEIYHICRECKRIASALRYRKSFKINKKR